MDRDHGLGTVYGILKQTGGYIWVSSGQGRVATFKVYLPRVEPAGEPVVARPSPARALGGTETILLAEDEAAVRNLARRLQNGLGAAHGAGGWDRKSTRLNSSHVRISHVRLCSGSN